MNIQTISLSDFNNNRYRVIFNKLTYQPMTPDKSSSGNYSGGKAYEKEISNETFNEICRKANEIVKNPRLHAEKRKKNTATISVKSNREFKRLIVMKSRALFALIEVLDKAEDLKKVKVLENTEHLDKTEGE